ncbi:MAG: protein nirF [Betaproteobacteria bacterium RBG_16_58_11]|nr:MAG: protein nirF [Betaproteobacteria bacterium RBG_16_58_11]
MLYGCVTPQLRATGDLGIIIERADGSVQIVDTTHQRSLAKISGLGDLSHASAVYSRDARYAYVFGRDGGLTKIDLLNARIEKRIIQAGNSIGGAISQDGKIVATSNYEPGGVKLFDAATLDLISEIPAVDRAGKHSKVVGLVDAPGNRFVFSLFEAGEIWVADVRDPRQPVLHKHLNIGRQPYDGTVTRDGRHYVAGLFGEDGLALLDLWNESAGVKRVAAAYGKGSQPLPVYKMPHLDNWAMSQTSAYVPAVGRHEVIVIDTHTWLDKAHIPVAGQPVFVVARPDGRHIWVNYAPPHNDTVQVIDVLTHQIIQTLHPGKAILHMEFTPRGEQVWLSVRDDDRVDVYDTETFQRIASIPAAKPSGIFFTYRAHRIGL